MKRFLFTLIFSGLIALAPFSGQAQNAVPVITNVLSQADTVGDVLRVTYDLADAENEDCEVWLRVMNNDTSYVVSTAGAFGDMGYPVSVGTNKMITWDYGPGHPDILNYDIQIVADDRFEIDIQTVVDQVDTMNLYNDLTWVQGIRHYTADSVHWRAVRDSAHSRFQAYGLESEIWQFEYLGINAANVIARKPGCVDETETYIVDAHYDGVAVAPGADDNGSGTVAVWEVARVLSQYDFKKNIRFINFDLEESGLVGSARYVNDGGIKSWETIEGVINYEMIGYYSDKDSTQIFPSGFDLLFPAAYDSMVAANWKGNFCANVANQNSSNLKLTFDTCAARYVPDMRVISIETPGTGLFTPDLRRSDHAKFWDVGIQALMITDAAEFRNANYHTPDDVMDSLNFEFMGHNAQATIAALCALAEIQHVGKEIGTVIVDPMSSIEDRSNELLELNVFPVPTNGDLQVKSNGFDQNSGNWSIVDLSGKEVMTGATNQLNNQFGVDVSQLPSGWYSIVVRGGSMAKVARFLVD